MWGRTRSSGNLAINRSPERRVRPFLTRHDIGGPAYSYPLDDVSSQSSTVQVPAPEHMCLVSVADAAALMASQDVRCNQGARSTGAP